MHDPTGHNDIGCTANICSRSTSHIDDIAEVGITDIIDIDASTENDDNVGITYLGTTYTHTDDGTDDSLNLSTSLHGIL